MPEEGEQKEHQLVDGHVVVVKKVLLRVGVQRVTHQCHQQHKVPWLAGNRQMRKETEKDRQTDRQTDRERER